MSAHPSVVHVGPDPSHPGGIGSVIQVLCDHRIGGRGEVVVSWVPDSRLGRLRAFASAAGQIARLPRSVIVHVHMAAGGSVARKGLLLAVARRSGHATAATLHGSSFAATAARRPRITAAALRRCNVILVLSPEMERIVRTLAPAVDVHEFANPVEPDGQASAAASRPRTVLFAGEVGLRKGADVLCAAWPAVRAEVPDAELVIAGPPTTLVVEPAPGVTVLGPVSRDEIRSRLRAARVVALPSRAEALPMILLEAMAAGAPFVSTDVGDIPRLTGTGAGVLVPAGDADALARALIELLTDDPRADRAGEAGVRACAEQFSLTALAAKTEAIYAGVRRR